MIVTSADSNIAKLDEFQVVQPDDDAGWDALAREVEAHGCHIGPRWAALMAAPLTAADLVGVPDYWRKIILRPIDPRLVAKAMRQARKYGWRLPDAEPVPLRALGADTTKGIPNAMAEITLFTKSSGPLTKLISIEDDGSLKSDGSACVMSSGTAERVAINDIAHFGEVIGGLSSTQAIALGALRAGLPGKVMVTTTKAMNGTTKPGIIARTAANIVYQGSSGLALIDFDTKGMPDDIKARLDELGGCWPALLSLMPCLRDIARVVRASTSAGLYRTDTAERLAGSNGLHIYLAVKEASDIERFVRTLHDRAWLAGFGWLMPGAGGQLLERSIVDRMVGAPERLIFEGPPVLVPQIGQDQKARRPAISEGGVLDTVSACPPINIVQKARLQEMKSKAAYQLAGKAAKARAAFIDKQAARLVQRNIGISSAAAKEIANRQCSGVLLPDVLLPFDDPDLDGTTVADVLANAPRYEGETLADPIEGIDYGRCKAKVMLNPDGTPWINSFAHGRTVYELKRDAKAVRAAIDVAAKEEVLATFTRLALSASLDAVETGDLIARVKERTGSGVRAITRTLNQTKDKHAVEQRQFERNRRAAERIDPRPLIPAPDPDAPWLPEMAVFNDVLAKAGDSVPPTRNINGDANKMHKIEITGTHAFTDAEGETS